MQNVSDHQSKFIFLGMPVTFSIRVLDGLLQAGKRPSAICIADDEAQHGPGIRQLPRETSSSELPLVKPYLQEGIVQMAWEQDIPVFAIGDLSSLAAAEWLNSLHTDVGIVACFPKRLPQEILTIPRSGFLNLHPSLLPAYRGPFPMFWTFRHALRKSGITLHLVDNDLDTGDIALQTHVLIPDGISSKEADELFAAEGTSLIIRALAGLAAGNLAYHAQGANASYYGRPSAEDFLIPTTWTAQRAFNFMRGTVEWQMPYKIQGDGFESLVRSAIACSSEGHLDVPFVKHDKESWIMFKTGFLHARSW